LRSLYNYCFRVPILKLLPLQIGGILLAQVLRLPWVLLLSLFAIELLILVTSVYRWVIPLIIITMMLLRWQAACRWPMPDLKPGSRYRMTGVVRSVKKSSYDVKVDLRSLDEKWNLLARFDREFKLLPGDTLTLEGIFTLPDQARNPGAFDYRAYLRRQGIVLVTDGKATLLDQKAGSWSLNRQYALIRNGISAILKQTIDAPFAGVMQGLLLGERGEIDPEIRSRFQKIGVVHILAVSGLHVGFILLILTLIGKTLRLNDGLKTVVIIAGLVFYMGLTGYPPSVVRAGIMAILYTVGKYFEKDVNPWNIVGLTAFLILFVKPDELFSPAFQLSFCAVAGILLVYPRLQSWEVIFPRWRKLRKIKAVRLVTDLVGLSAGAQLGTFIPAALLFRSYPVWGIFANIFIVPLTGLAVTGGILTVVFYCINPFAGTAYGGTTWGTLYLMNAVSKFFSSLPFAGLPLGGLSLAVVFAIPVLVYFILTPAKRYFQRLIILTLFTLSLFVWQQALKERVVRITFLDVGQGDCCVIEDGGHAIIVDAGYAGFGKDYGKRVLLPYLKYRGITAVDLLILTHPHADHIGGAVSLLEELKVTTVWEPRTNYHSELYKSVQADAQSRHCTLDHPDAGAIYRLGQLTLTVLYPDSLLALQSRNLNDASLIIRVDHADNSFLFMGDAESPAEQIVAQMGAVANVDLVKIGHHGSVTSSSQEFAGKTHAKIGIISVGRGNKFGHPSSTVLKRWEALGTRSWRTDRSGAVTVISKGGNLLLFPMIREKDQPQRAS